MINPPRPLMDSPLQMEQTSEQPTIPNYLVWTILVTSFCCIPTGIYSIILATRVDSLVAAGKIEEAKQTSKNVKKWIFISLGGWFLMVLFYLFFVGGLYFLEKNKCEFNLHKSRSIQQSTHP